MAKEKLSNIEVVAIAVFLAGGALSPADTEDVAMKTTEIAPGRFAWRKYPEQVNIEQVRRRLTDAATPEKGGFVSGSQRTGWQLTPRGVAFAERTLPALSPTVQGRQPMSANERKWVGNERVRLLASKAMEEYRAEGATSVSRRHLEEFFRVNDYVQGASREKKIDRLVNAFRDDADLGEVVAVLAAMLRKEDSNA